MYCGYSDYVLKLCTVGTVTMYSSRVLWVQRLCIEAVYCGYSDYVFELCTVGTETMNCSCVLCTVGTVTMYSSCVLWVP